MLNKCNDIPKLICMYCCCSARTTVVNARLTKQVRNSEAVARRRMNEVDEHGWAHIHQAARKGDLQQSKKLPTTSKTCVVE